SLGDVADYIRAIYYKQGLIDSAYLYQEKHFIYADSLNKDNSNLKFTELKHELETELERQKTELRIQKRFYIYLLVFTILVLTIVILVLLYTRQKIKIRNTLLEKDNLSKSIELKNRELANSILNSQKKNELINTAIRDLEINKDSYPETSRQLLNQVISNLGTAMDENGWKDFELIFSQVHESFFIGLDQRCPGLSTKERRLCALLRLDMSSKEIAEVTQMTPRSVDTARYRIRKKLGIENNEESDLLTFMRSF
nr:hypothetical protein [Bacteroidota bacterium]